MIGYSKNYVHMTDHQEGRPFSFIPMVYENEAPRTQRWEYHTLKIDAQEQALPNEPQLNVLGQEGWILVGLLDERASGRGSFVYYYFARQAKDE